ncbi:RNA-binding protein 8a [Phtheirospermum japonicum]|uniref:RNA-binding protein 8A n=1 Tax=Phtheirospermum japonicum TaxID=374723 RepID=A0A830CGG2_9LAMI|nr:RNA-binding protein 8a [Phtheirospermum japonicum]
MDEDVSEGVSPNQNGTAAIPWLRSTIAGRGGSSWALKKTKCRGFRDEATAKVGRSSRMSARFDSLDFEGGPGPERSIEGSIVLVTGVHEEAQEDDIQNSFGEYGEIKSLNLNLYHRMGFIKGYALIEYEKFKEVKCAIRELDGKELLTQIINVNWAFNRGLFRRRNMRGRSPRGHCSRTQRRRF